MSWLPRVILAWALALGWPFLSESFMAKWISNALLLIIIIAVTDRLTAAPQKLVFVSQGQSFVSDLKTLQKQQISKGAAINHMPKWSPDGTKIVYLSESTTISGLGTLVVAAPDGRQIGEYPIPTRTATGTVVAGMRAVERIGWFDDSGIFASGSVNPYSEEYRIINTQSGQVEHGFIGTKFSTCGRSGVVAFWDPVFPPSKSMSLEISTSKAPVFIVRDVGSLPTLNIPLEWDEQCKYVAFIEGRTPQELVVIGRDGSKVQMKLPSGTTSSVSATQDGYLIGNDRSLYYDSKSARLMPTPGNVLETTRIQAEQHRHAVSVLDATEADWW